MTDSVRRSIEAVTEGLELAPPGLHLIPPHARQPSTIPMFRRGAQRRPRPSPVPLSRPPSACTILRSTPNQETLNAAFPRPWSRFTRFQVSADSTVTGDAEGRGPLRFAVIHRRTRILCSGRSGGEKNERRKQSSGHIRLRPVWGGGIIAPSNLSTCSTRLKYSVAKI